jgi:hypothetical protein
VTACRVCVQLGGGVCVGVQEGWVSRRGWHVHVRVWQWGGTVGRSRRGWIDVAVLQVVCVYAACC